MIIKEIKEYKHRDKTIQRINILQQDNVSGKVYIFEEKEYNELKKEINELKESETELFQKLENKKKELENINIQIDKQYQTIERLDKQHIEQLKESYDKFNEELKRYITVNQLQNTALKQILELGFIDLIRNRHKKIAKDQIKELKEDKKVYELTEKKE